MKLDDAAVLITGANRGLGLAFAREALVRGARTVYAGARDPSKVTLKGVVPVKLDVTNPEEVSAAAQRCGDVALVVNNAGIGEVMSFLAEGAIESARRQLETNFFGIWRVSRAFAPVLRANGGGALLNVLSRASWAASPTLAVYGATKSAAWALTNGLRHELREQKTQVLALHAAFIDTDLVARLRPPQDVARGSRAARVRRARRRCRRGDGRRADPAGQARPLGDARRLHAAARELVVGSEPRAAGRVRFRSRRRRPAGANRLATRSACRSGPIRPRRSARRFSPSLQPPVSLTWMMRMHTVYAGCRPKKGDESCPRS